MNTKNSFTKNVPGDRQLYIKNSFIKDALRDRQLYIMLLPFVLFYVVFAYLPMYGLQIAFKDFSIFKGIEASPWVGLDNFTKFLTSPYFGRTLKNTLLISVYSMAWGFPVPIALSILLNEVRHKTYKGSVQTLIYVPHFVSIVVVAGLVTSFLSPDTGLVNLLLCKAGGDSIYFLTEPRWFRTIYIAMNVWKESGFSSIIYLAAITSIDQQLYEAAVIDGANKWRQLWNITIPGLLPTIVIMFIMRVGTLLEVGYEAIILLYQPATFSTADVISTYVYRSGIVEQQYSLASAVGLFNGVVGLVLVTITNYLSKKTTETGLW